MAYWTDDRALDMEQRRLDAEQARAKRVMERQKEPDCYTCNDDPNECRCMVDLYPDPPSKYCAICDCHNGHSLSCATLNVRGDVINH